MGNTVVIRKLHFLDRINKQIDDRDLTSGKGIEYTDSIIEETIKQQNTREFDTQSDSSVVNHIVSILRDCSTENIQSTCGILATRLIEKEAIKQQKIEKFRDLQKGGLFQSLIKSDEDPSKSSYLFAKIDFSSVRDEVNFEYLCKLPDKHKVFKSCIFCFTDLTLESVHIYDSSPQLASYWWQDYFELMPIVDNEMNTKNVLSETRSIINQNTKNKQADRKALFNRAAMYMEQHDTFVLEEYIASIFGGYTPRSENLKLDALRDKLSDELKKSVKRIDRQFTIHMDTVKRMIVEKNVTVNDNVEITLKGCVDDRPDLIKSYIDGDDKYLRVKIANEYSELFDRFRSKDAQIE